MYKANASTPLMEKHQRFGLLSAEGGGIYVLIKRKRNDISESDRGPLTGSASGELQRSGRIQRYADNAGV